MTRILDKTAKGREEIATRQYRLAPRLRTLLVLIDGKHGESELLRQVAGLGLNEQSIAELLENGFIAAHEAADIVAGAAAAPATPVKKSAAAAPHPGAASLATADAGTETAVLEPPPSNGFLPPGENQFQALYNFFTSTIKSTIGLRGYGLQLKVERAGSIDEFRALRQPYVEAVLKAKGPEMARSLRDRLDQLLYLGQPPADLHPLI